MNHQHLPRMAAERANATRSRFDTRLRGALLASCTALAMLPPLFAACASAPYAGAGAMEGAAPTAARDSYVTTADGARLHIRSIGAGRDTILVVHGGAGLDMNYLVHGLEGLERGRTLIFYDQRGTGGSGDMSDTSRFTMPGFVDDLDQVRATLELGRVNLLGHSWGALLAMRYAMLHPERVGSLVLVSPMEPGSRFRAQTGERQRGRVNPEDAAVLARLTKSPGFRNGDVAVIDSVYRVSFRASFSDRSKADALVIDPAPATAKNGGRVAQLVFTSMGTYDYWGDVPSVRSRTLIVHGEDDPIPPDFARALGGKMPNATVAVLPAAGHFPFLEQRATFTKVVTEFWEARRRVRQ